MSSKPKIIITIEHEGISSIVSNTDIEYIIVDYSYDDVNINGPNKQDKLFINGKAYKLIEDKDINLPISEEETEVITHLKECKF